MLVYATFIRHFGSAIVKKVHNPYLNLNDQQLEKQINFRINNNDINIDNLNILIKLGIATTKKHNYIQTPKLATKCIRVLQQIHQNANQLQTPENIGNVQLGLLVELMSTTIKNNSNNRKFALKMQVSSFAYLYENTFANLITIDKHLSIYEHSKLIHQKHFLDQYDGINMQQKFENINTLSKFIISQQILGNHITIHNYIQYCRLFIGQLSAVQFIAKLKVYTNSKKDISNNMSQKQKGTLCYISSLLLSHQEYQSAIPTQFQPQLQANKDDDIKLMCFKLELMKFKSIPIRNLSAHILQLEIEPHCNNTNKWDYDHLVWLSEFISPQTCSDYIQLSRCLHKQLLMSKIGQNTSITTFLHYVKNMRQFLTYDRHKQLSLWLLQQDLDHQKQKDLCELLYYIDDNLLQQNYHIYFKKVLQLSLGRFQWEQQNIIYYYGTVWKIEDDNMEYLRRYIINGYVSFGVNRRQIPTSSYFYKILAVTNTEQFYGNL